MISGKPANSRHFKSKKVDENDFARTLFRRLKTQENILSNEYSIISLMINDIIMKKLIEKLNKNRNKTWDQLMESYMSLRDELNIAANKISTLQKIKNLDVEGYREEVEHVQSKIALNRNTLYQKKKNLENMADLLIKELQCAETKVTEVMKPKETIKYMNIIPSKLKQSNSSGCQYAAVEDFEKFLKKSGGHAGGWSIQEHFIFLKEYNKIRKCLLLSDSKGNNKIHTQDLINFLAERIPGTNLEKVKEHYDWYVKYKSLKHKHNEAIQTWRAKKDQRCSDKILAQNYNTSTEAKKICSDTNDSKEFMNAIHKGVTKDVHEPEAQFNLNYLQQISDIRKVKSEAKQIQKSINELRNKEVKLAIENGKFRNMNSKSGSSSHGFQKENNLCQDKSTSLPKVDCTVARRCRFCRNTNLYSAKCPHTTFLTPTKQSLAHGVHNKDR